MNMQQVLDVAMALAAMAPTILDTLNDKIDAVTVTIRGAVIVVAILLFIIVAARSRLRLAPTVLALVGAACVIWLAAGGGLEWFAGLLGREFAEGPLDKVGPHGQLGHGTGSAHA